MSRTLNNQAWRWSSIATVIFGASAAFAEAPASTPPDQGGLKVFVAEEENSTEAPAKVPAGPGVELDRSRALNPYVPGSPAREASEGQGWMLLRSKPGSENAVAEAPNPWVAAARRRSTYLGVEISPATPALRAQLGLAEGTGLVVDQVINDSPAQKGGVQNFDVLQKLDEQVLVNSEQLAVLVHMHKPGESVGLALIRHGQPMTIKVPLGTGAGGFGAGGFGAAVRPLREGKFQINVPETGGEGNVRFEVVPSDGDGNVRFKVGEVERERKAKPSPTPAPAGDADQSNVGQAEATLLYAQRSQMMAQELEKLKAASARAGSATGSAAGAAAPHKFQVQSAKLELEAARLQLERQKARFDELSRLKASGAVNEAEFRNAELEMKLTEIQVKRAELNLQMAQHAPGGE